MIIPIDDPADSRIEAYRAIKERDLIGRDGCFIAEGRVVLDVLLCSRHDTLSLLIAESRLDGLRPLIASLPQAVPVYVAGQGTMDGIAGFPMHRGILALGRRAPEPEPAAALAALGGNALVVALLGIANHDNMGGIFRNAAAFGAALVLLDSGCCDPLYRKAIRVSVGGALIVPFVRFPRHIDVLELLETACFEALALTPSGETKLGDMAPVPRAAVLFGTEGRGLPADVLARARQVRIPMSGVLDSLNVATASGIVLHHLTRTRVA